MFVGGVDVGEKGQSLIEIRREVGLVFQYPEYQLFEETVEKDVGFGPRNLGLDEETVKTRVREALSQVGLGEDILEKSPFELSGGQKRRVAIAGVLAMKPGTLVLDEPVAGLDPAGREELLSLIQGIHERGVTIVMVTHSMDDAARFCDRLIVLDHGRVAFDAAPGEVFRHEEELRQMGLDVPECVKLVKALKARGMDLGEGLYRMEDVRAAFAGGGEMLKKHHHRPVLPRQFLRPPPRPAHKAAVDPRPHRRGLSLAGLSRFVAVLGYVLLAARMSKIHLRFLVRGLKPVAYIVLITFLLNIFFQSEGTALFSWKFITVTDMGLRRAAFLAVRLVMLITASQLLTLTTSAISLTDGMESLMRPLTRLRFPAHEIAMMMSIALRFIPR